MSWLRRECTPGHLSGCGWFEVVSRDNARHPEGSGMPLFLVDLVDYDLVRTGVWYPGAFVQEVLEIGFFSSTHRARRLRASPLVGSPRGIDSVRSKVLPLLGLLVGEFRGMQKLTPSPWPFL